MQEQVYQTPIHDVNDLKKSLLNVWGGSGSEDYRQYQ